MSGSTFAHSERAALEKLNKELDKRKSDILSSISQVLTESSTARKNRTHRPSTTTEIESISTSRNATDDKKVEWMRNGMQTSNAPLLTPQIDAEEEFLDETPIPNKALSVSPSQTSSTSNAHAKVVTKFARRQTVEEAHRIRENRLLDEIEHLREELMSERQENAESKKKLSLAETDSRRIQIMAKSSKGEAKSTLDQLQEANNRISDLSIDKANMDKISKQMNDELKAKDVELNRLRRDLAASRRNGAKTRIIEPAALAQDNDVADDSMMRKKVSQLEKMNQDAMQLVSKQGQLIQVLKRQKCHLEAARLIAFTEEEFLRIIQYNEHK